MIEWSCVPGVCVCVYMNAHMLVLILACGAGGLQVSNSSAIFRGHISSAAGSPAVCQSESHPPLSFAPHPPALPAPHPCPYSRAASSPTHAACCIPLCLPAYLVPAVLQASASLRLALARAGQLWTGGAGGEGGEQGRGCCQCYFELLTEQHQEETPRSGLLRARPCG